MKCAQTTVLLLALAALSACTSQPQQAAETQSPPPAPATESTTASEKPSPEKQPPLKPDVDPYFRESTGISSKTGPGVITRNILQDSQGGYWLATWNGIIRYDGTTFTNVTNKEGLRRYRAFSLLEDHQGNIWVGTCGAGLYRYDGSTYTNFTTEDGLVDNTVLSIMQDRDNNLWFGGMGLTKYDGTTFTSFGKEDGFTNRDVNSISQAPDGSLWFGTRGALFHYDGEAFANFTEKHGVKISSNSYIPTLMDRSGHLWFSGNDGLFHYDGEHVRHLFQPTSFSLMEDSNGHIWFSGGAYKGEDPTPGASVLNRFDPAAGIENIMTAIEQIEVEAGMIFGLSEDKDGIIWFGTGGGVGRIGRDAVHLYTSTLVRRVQEALTARGYDVGAAGADNLMGPNTKAALTQFQIDRDLPVGKLDDETLNAMGIER